MTDTQSQPILSAEDHKLLADTLNKGAFKDRELGTWEQQLVLGKDGNLISRLYFKPKHHYKPKSEEVKILRDQITKLLDVGISLSRDNFPRRKFTNNHISDRYEVYQLSDEIIEKLVEKHLEPKNVEPSIKQPLSTSRDSNKDKIEIYSNYR